MTMLLLATHCALLQAAMTKLYRGPGDCSRGPQNGARASSGWPYQATASVLKGLPAGALHHLFAVQCTQGAGTGYGDTGLLCCTVCFCLMSWTRLPAHWYKRGLSLVAWLFARSSLAAWLPLAEQISSVQ